VDVLKDGWARVPIPAGLLVREARVDGKLVSLVYSGVDSAALLPKRGRSTLTLEIALPVTPSAGSQKLALPASASGVTRASVALTRLDLDIQVAGGFLAERAESGGESKWLAYGEGNVPLTFTWRRKTEEHKEELPLRMRGTLTELIGLGEDSSSVYAEVNLEIVQGAAHEVRVALPENVKINQVLGAGVGDWEDRKGELAVRFLEPVEKSTAFVITGDTRLARDGPIAIPLLRLFDVERETGGVAVEVLGAGEIKSSRPQGLENADARDLGQTVAARESPSLAAYRFRAGSDPAARTLTVDVARYKQQAVLTANVEEARYRALMTREGKTLVEAQYRVRNNQRNFVKMTLPAGAVVWSAALAGKAVHPGEATDGGLLFPLSKSTAGEDSPPFMIEIVYQAPGSKWEEKSRADLLLPALDLPISRTGVRLFYPPGYRIAPGPGTFRYGAYAEASVPVSDPPAVAANQQSDLLQQLNNNAAQAATQALVDRYRASNKKSGAQADTWSEMEFPAVGPSIYLVSELTSENQAAALQLNYQRESEKHDGKGGVQ
jgi:hypothetical protein